MHQRNKPRNQRVGRVQGQVAQPGPAVMVTTTCSRWGSVVSAVQKLEKKLELRTSLSCHHIHPCTFTNIFYFLIYNVSMIILALQFYSYWTQMNVQPLHQEPAAQVPSAYFSFLFCFSDSSCSYTQHVRSACTCDLTGPCWNSVLDPSRFYFLHGPRVFGVDQRIAVLF